MKGKTIDLSPVISDRCCFVCSKLGRGLIKMELIGNRYICPLCNSSETYTLSTNKIDYAFRKAHDNATINNDLLDYFDICYPHTHHSFLSLLLGEARESIMFGHYISGILVLNNYVEALAKEIIFINEGRRSHKSFGPTIDLLKSKKYISEEDADRLSDFKNDTRNPYTHGDASQILQKIYTPIREIVTTDPDSSYLSCLMKESKENIRYINMADAPNTAFVGMYNSTIKKQAIDAYNDVVDIARDFTMKYLVVPPVRREIVDAFEKGLTEEKITKAKEIDKEIRIDNGEGALILSGKMIEMIRQNNRDIDHNEILHSFRIGNKSNK